MQSQNDAAVPYIQATNKYQHRVIIAIVVYLEKQNSKRASAYLWPHTLYQTPMITPSNSNTQQYKRTSCSSRANMNPVTWISLWACSVQVFGRHVAWRGFDIWSHTTTSNTNYNTFKLKNTTKPAHVRPVRPLPTRHRSVWWTQIESPSPPPSPSLCIWTTHEDEITNLYVIKIKHFKSERAAIQTN